MVFILTLLLKKKCIIKEGDNRTGTELKVNFYRD